VNLPHPLPFSLIHRYHSEKRESALVDVDGLAVHVTLKDGELEGQVGCDYDEEADYALEKIAEHLRRADGPEGKRIPMYLWVSTDNGARKIRRDIDVPSWEDVRLNSPGRTYEELGRLMTDRPESGKVILWHGPPGTGFVTPHDAARRTELLPHTSDAHLTT
jgi:hypothetical protein